MKQTVFLSASLLLATVFLACHSQKTTADQKMNNEQKVSVVEDKYWQLQSIAGKEIPEGLLKTPYLQLASDGKKVSGTGGCNQFFGNYTLSEGNKLTFGELGATQMACEQMETEGLLFESLRKVRGYVLTSKGLRLMDENKGELARFVEVENHRLNGTWRLSVFPEGKRLFDSLAADEIPQIAFQLPSKNVSGRGLCNRFTTQVETQDQKLQFSAISATKMRCPREGEELFFRALEGVNRFHLSEDNKTLTLFRGDLLFMTWTREQ